MYFKVINTVHRVFKQYSFITDKHVIQYISVSGYSNASCYISQL